MCDPSYIGSLLGQFYSARQNELTSSSKNENAILTYDSPYLIGPFLKALYQKDSSGKLLFYSFPILIPDHAPALHSCIPS